MNDNNVVIKDARTLGVPKMLLLGLQHMFAMFGATILVPILVNNYFEGEGLSIQVTLICAGLGTLFFHVCAKISKLRREGYTIPPDGRIDLSKLPDRLLSETRQQFGFNQLFRPVFIDRDTFDKLTAIREDDYRAMLAPCMDNEAVDAAVSRLKDAQRHAARLEREHRVVEDWAAPGIKETYARHKVGAKGSFGERIQNGFFTRDFLTKFSAIL